VAHREQVEPVGLAAGQDLAGDREPDCVGRRRHDDERHHAPALRAPGTECCRRQRHQCALLGEPGEHPDDDGGPEPLAVEERDRQEREPERERLVGGDQQGHGEAGEREETDAGVAPMSFGEIGDRAGRERRPDDAEEEQGQHQRYAVRGGRGEGGLQDAAGPVRRRVEIGLGGLEVGERARERVHLLAVVAGARVRGCAEVLGDHRHRGPGSTCDEQVLGLEGADGEDDREQGGHERPRRQPDLRRRVHAGSGATS
jgi:hypothetical protein